MFNFNNTDIRTTSLVSSRRFNVFIVNFEHISHLSSGSIADLEQVSICWVTPVNTLSKFIMFIIN